MNAVGHWHLSTGSLLRHLAVAVVFLAAGAGWILESHLEHSAAARASAATEPADFHGTDLLPTLKGPATRNSDGNLVLVRNQRATTALSYRPPVHFRIVAMTNGTNIRFRYAADQIIFNWEVDPHELRIDGGPADGRHSLGEGHVPVGQWVRFDLFVRPDQMIIFVDGKERFRTNADFSRVNQPLQIFPQNGSTVKVKSVMAESR